MTSRDDAQPVLAIFQEELATSFGWLEDLGYTRPTYTVERNTMDDTIIEARFKAPAREITFYLAAVQQPRRDGGNRNVLVVAIYRRGSDVDDGDPANCLYVDWFAAVHRRDLSDRLEELADRGDPKPEFIRAAVPIYRMLMQRDLHAVVSGQEWRAGTGVVSIARDFDFLVTEYGFSHPEGFSAGVQSGNRYRRGDVELCLSFEGGFVMSVSAGVGTRRTMYHLRSDEAAAFLKEHPEVAAGDFRAVDALLRARP